MIRHRETDREEHAREEASTPAREESMDPVTKTGTVAGAAFVNLRATPSGKGKVVVVMERFDTVEILREGVKGEGGLTFLKVRHESKSVGYVPASFIFVG